MKDDILDSFENWDDKSSKLVRIKQFDFETEAQFYRTRLQSEGIPCFLTNTNTTTLLSGYSIATGGVSLYVKASDVDAVLLILDELDYNKSRKLDEDFREADLEEILYQKSLHESKHQFKNWLNVLAAVFVVFLLILWLMSIYRNFLDVP